MTTRANPDRSFEVACRHLFRHLRDPAELRRNPIVRDAFASGLKGSARVRSDAAVASSIRDAVRRLAASCFAADGLEDPDRDEVLRAIVDADIQRSSRSRVAAELGLSQRQYSRLQHGIRARIAAALTVELAAVRAAASSHNDVASPLPAVAELASRARPAEALSRLAVIIDQSGPGLTALALCLRATILQHHFGDAPGAGRALTLARQCLQGVEIDDPLRPTAAAEIDLASIGMDAVSGRYDRVTQNAERLIAHAHQNGTPRFQMLRAYTAAAYGKLFLGKRSEALQYDRWMLGELPAAKGASLPEQIEIALELGVVLAELGHVSEASGVLAHAWALARQRQLEFDLVWLDLEHTSLSLEYDVSIAIERLPEICDASRRLGAPGLIARAYAYLARAQSRVARPNADQILANAKEALRIAPRASSEWITSKTAEAYARLLLNDVAGAERCARDADDAAAAAGNQTYRAITFCELARVAAAQGRRRDAKRAIVAAIDAGYTAVKRQQIVLALALAATILNDRTYAAEARAMQEAIALSGPFLTLNALG